MKLAFRGRASDVPVVRSFVPIWLSIRAKSKRWPAADREPALTGLSSERFIVRRVADDRNCTIDRFISGFRLGPSNHFPHLPTHTHTHTHTYTHDRIDLCSSVDLSACLHKFEKSIIKAVIRLTSFYLRLESTNLYHLNNA